MFFINFYCFILIILSSFTGCRVSNDKAKEQIEADSAIISKLDLHDMPNTAPDNIEKRLAWGLWKLDMNNISDTLAAGANPYTLAQVVDISSKSPDSQQLSPYALIMEGYLARTHLEENFENICKVLMQLYECIELLIKKKISVDSGVLIFGSHATMRNFAIESLDRLQAEKNSQVGFDEEGECALTTWQNILILIDKYQPK